MCRRPRPPCPEMPCSSTCSAEALLVIAGLPTNWLDQHSSNSNLCLRKFLCTFPPVISSPFSPNGGVDRLVILQIPSLYIPSHSLQAVSQVKSLSIAFIDIWRKINSVSIWRCSEDERGCGQWIAGSEDGYTMSYNAVYLELWTNLRLPSKTTATRVSIPDIGRIGIETENVLQHYNQLWWLSI